MIPGTGYHYLEEIFRTVSIGLKISGLYPDTVDTIPEALERDRMAHSADFGWSAIVHPVPEQDLGGIGTHL